MEKLFNYIKINIKYASKSVFHKFKEYIPFFAALFIIQSVFFSIFITTATNAKNTEEKLYQKFDYDIVISGLDYNQTLVPERQLYIKSFMRDRMFEEYKIEQAPEKEGGDYRIYITMRDGEDLDYFLKTYIYEPLNNAENIRVSTSPLYEYKTASLLSDSPSLFLWIIMCFISIGAITAIYSVRINNQKFLYGIYITFGANLKKLISTSVFEMIILAALSFLPATLFTYVIASIAYIPFGILPILNIKILLRVLISIFIISICGAYIPMKIVSKKTPLSLISSQDNSNFASSPIKSTNFLGKTFPKNYEALSFWRFRKYYASLLLSSVLFTSVFVCGFYISDTQKASLDTPIKEFVIFNESRLSESEQKLEINTLCDSILSKEGIDSISWQVDTPASLINSIMILPKKNLHSAGGLYTTTKSSSIQSEEMQTVYDDFKSQNYTNVVNSFKYSALDENLAKNIESEYVIEGDINSIFNSPNTVVISEEIFNTQKFKFEVGDKIIIAKHTETLSEFGGDYFDTVAVLNYMINDNIYEFYEFTVGAVIKKYGDTEGYFTVGFNDEDYQNMTGNSFVPTEMNVMLDADISSESVEDLRQELNEFFYETESNYSLTQTYDSVSRDIKMQKNSRFFIIFLSSLVLLMSPILWFFTQSAFFAKREKELFVLRAYGAKEKKISQMFLRSGTISSILGFGIATIMSLPASYLIFKLMTNWLPSWGIIRSESYFRFALSPISILVCAVVSGLCGLLSAIIPYKISLRRYNKNS